ncbi:MAG: hypothetical protein HQ521_17330 [Bacteroidetes bacterium]|nr:hypothetical protein [Bacteroidota bacterium]
MKKQISVLTLFLSLLLYYGVQIVPAQSIIDTTDYYITNGEIEFLGYDIMVSTELTESGYAANNLQHIEIKNGQNIYIFVDWYNLPVREHLIEYVFKDGDNNFILRHEYTETPKNSRYYIYLKLPFYSHFISHNTVLIRISIDDYLLAEKEFTVSFTE